MRSWLISSMVALAAASAISGAKIQFSKSDYRVIEGDEQAIALVELTDCPTRAPLGSVGVQVVSTDGSALEGVDYFAFSRFQIGSTPPPPGSKLGRVFKTQEVPIHVVDDDEEEDEEGFFLTLTIDPDATLDCGSGPEHPQLGEQAAITIVSNDERTSRLEFDDVDPTVREGDGAERAVGRARVRRIGGEGSAAVTCITEENDSAVGGRDFVPVRQTLRWKDGESGEKVCEVEILGDDLVEGREEVRLSLVEPSRGTTLGARSSTVLQIEDDDDAGKIAFTAVEYPVVEGQGDVEVLIGRQGGTDGAISVEYFARAGSARPGEDFEPAQGRLVWSSGESAPKAIRLHITDDREAEPDEAFTLLLSSPSGGATLGDFANAVVVIGDDDGGAENTIASERAAQRPTFRRKESVPTPAPAAHGVTSYQVTEVTDTSANGAASRLPTLRISNAVVLEGDSGVANAVFEVTLSPASDRVVTVDFSTVDDSATVSDDDYRPRSGRFRFGPGQTSLRFNVQVLGDGFVEGNQNFHVLLSHAIGAELATPWGNATILDDDVRRASTD